MNKELSNKLHLLIRSERALLKLEMNKKGRQVLLATIALLALLATLVMLNVSIFLYLEESFTVLHSALILTGINLALAIVFLMLASRQELGSEAEAVHEIRDYALKELSGEFDEIKQEASEIRESFSKVSSGISSVFNRDFSALKAVLPLVEMFVKTRKQEK
ncbi:MAG: phage holin family protein [Sulfurimonadaceae bacterium]